MTKPDLLLDRLRREFVSAEFLPECLRQDVPVPQGNRAAAMVAFADRPFDSRTACVAVVIGEQFGDADLMHLRPLGAPLLFQCGPDQVTFWSQGTDRPRFQQRLEPHELPRFFRENRDVLSPQAIYRAKLWGRLERSYQLSFVDAGLMPLVEEEAGQKLTGLVERIVKETKGALGWGKDIAEGHGRWLIQSTFWLLAAKILQDKGVPGFIRLDLTDVEAVYERIAKHYNSDQPKPVRVSSKAKRKALASAAETIKRFGHCGCVSTEALAHVYESALIDRETRRELGTHSTPPWLVDYIVGRLRPWIEELDVSDRRVFEPACGHSAFLISAMRMLSELLPTDWPESRRQYLRRRLHGVEIDAFALEIARLSLTLADVPNANGWALTPGNMFQHNRLEDGVRGATIVLGNPPFESFGAPKPSVDSLPNKAAETFRRVVDNLQPGAMFGFVLPQTFLHSKQAIEVRKRLLDDFEIAEISLFADKVFRHGQPESAVIIGRRCPHDGTRPRAIRYQRVRERQVAEFSRSYEPTVASQVEIARLTTSEGASFRVPELSDVWDALAEAPSLDEFVDAGKGFDHKGDDDPTLPAGVVKASAVEFPNSVPGFKNWQGDPLTHGLPDLVWLNLDCSVLGAERRGTKSGVPQVLLNYGRAGRERWRLKALIDEQGHPVTSRFIVVRPTERAPSLPVLWAVLNSPIANAYASCLSSKRDVQSGDISQLPVPDFDELDCSALEEAAEQYLEAARAAPVTPAASGKRKAKRPKRSRGQALLFPEDSGLEHGDGRAQSERLEYLHWRVDAEVLRLYDLPAHLERQVLDLFTGVERKGVPFVQTEYFPPDFTEFDRLSELIAITVDWPKTNRRRSRLMDIEEEGRLTAKQAHELGSLQRLADARVSLSRPVLLEGADQIIEDLKRRGVWTDPQA